MHRSRPLCACMHVCACTGQDRCVRACMCARAQVKTAVCVHACVRMHRSRPLCACMHVCACTGQDRCVRACMCARAQVKTAAGCSALLGIAHTHRGTGHLERRTLKSSKERRLDYSGTMSLEAIDALAPRPARGRRGVGKRGGKKGNGGGKGGGGKSKRVGGMSGAGRSVGRGGKGRGKGGGKGVAGDVGGNEGGGGGRRLALSRQVDPSQDTPTHPKTSQEGGGRFRGRRLRHHPPPTYSPTDPHREPFVFGYRYTHLWYTLQPHPPYRTLATSGEFCIGAEQDRRDCESVQFISGLALEARTDPANASLLLSLGKFGTCARC